VKFKDKTLVPNPVKRFRNNANIIQDIRVDIIFVYQKPENCDDKYQQG
jgi:hypothetical protein